jgi:hypothetical protein
MRNVLLGVALAAAVTTAASAQYQSYKPYQPPTYQAPKTTNTFDWQSGNSYTTTTKPNGGADVRGMNLNNGSMWNTQIDPKGNQRGTDADGNLWTYDARSKTYMNLSTGKMCMGEGMGRICN